MCFVCVLHRLNGTLFRSHSCALHSSAAALRIGSAVVRVRRCCGLHAAFHCTVLQVHCFIIMRFILFSFPDLTRSISISICPWFKPDSRQRNPTVCRLYLEVGVDCSGPCLDCRQKMRNNRHLLWFAWYHGYGLMGNSLINNKKTENEK